MINDELKALIKEKKKSVRNLANIINVPYTTLDSLLKRPLETANATLVCAMCRELEISADALIDGRIAPAVIANITDIEQELIRMYRNSNNEGQSRIFEYSTFISQDSKYKKGYKLVKED